MRNIYIYIYIYSRLWAYRTESYIENVRNTGAKEINQKLDELHKAANETVFSSSGIRGTASYHTVTDSHAKSLPPKPPLTGVAGFFSAFRKEIMKDMGLGK
jgi:hypothetical protein